MFTVYAAGAAIIPLIIVLVLALTTQMVEVSLFTAIFIGACMVTGNIKDGFKRTLDEYILKALTDEDHVYVILFTLFLAGLVGMLERSGGMKGFIDTVSVYAKSARAGQLVCYGVGLFVM